MSYGTKKIWSLVVALAVSALVFTVVPAGASTSQPSISFLSPASFNGESPVLTDDDDGVDTAYRLSAWIAGAPADSMVEFELVPGDATTPPLTIGTGTSVGGDTFEYLWDIPEGPSGVLEGTHELRASLYGPTGEEALAFDQIEVSILHGATPTTAGEAALDLVQPKSGQPLGFHTDPAGVTSSVFEAKKQSGAAVTGWFTTSAPGSDPVWRVCNAGESDRDFADGVRCTMPQDDAATEDADESVHALSITAVALALSKDKGSADVARVFPYVQVPGAISYALFGENPATGVIDTKVAGTGVRTAGPDGTFGCSDWVRVAVVDQMGLPIGGMNIDVHAQGPSDQLKLHTSYNSVLSTPHSQAPDGTSHVTPTEPGTKCVRSHDAVPVQGEHPRPARPDIKHVESTGGTRDDGTFDIRVRADQAGETLLTVWADEMDDDRFCVDEAAGSNEIRLLWGEGDAVPISSEEPSTCEATGPFAREISAAPSDFAVQPGRAFTIDGSIQSDQAACVGVQIVKLKTRRNVSQRFRTIASSTTDEAGTYSFETSLTRSRQYRVVAPAAMDCLRAASPTVRVLTY